jgi:hypothetical protein
VRWFGLCGEDGVDAKVKSLDSIFSMASGSDIWEETSELATSDCSATEGMRGDMTAMVSDRAVGWYRSPCPAMVGCLIARPRY